jgi:hypothetical protein
MKPEHFERWVMMWNKIIDDHFEGPIAIEAKKSCKKS